MPFEKDTHYGWGNYGVISTKRRQQAVLARLFQRHEPERIRLVTREVSLGKTHPGIASEGLFVSADNKRVAYVAAHERKWLVVVDGVKGDEYDEIGPPVFSPDSRRLAYWGRRSGKWFLVIEGKVLEVPGEPVKLVGKNPVVVFSPDGRRFAYALERDRMQYAVVDGTEEGPYDRIYPASLVFSPDGSRLAYKAFTTSRGQFLVVDGVEQEASEESGALSFSPNSKRVAYMTFRRGRWMLVVDGSEGKDYEGFRVGGCSADPTGTEHLPSLGNSVFSPDSQHVAYAALRDGKWTAVIDGAEGNIEYEDIDALRFSPDSSRVAYWVMKGEHWCVVVDGAEGEQFDQPGRVSFISPDGHLHILLGDGFGYSKHEARGLVYARGPLAFSPDSKRLAYVAAWREKQAVVVDRLVHTEFDGIGTVPVFSPDSQQVAYLAGRGGRQVVVLNGAEGRPYDAVSTKLTFSPDSHHLAYVACRGRPGEFTWRVSVVADGAELKEYYRVEPSSVAFSPDSRHLAYVAATAGLGNTFIVVDAAESKRYGSFQGGSKLLFESASLLRGLAFRNREFFRVEVDLVAQ